MKIYLVKSYNMYWGSIKDSDTICAYLNEKDAKAHCDLFNGSDYLYKYIVVPLDCYDHLKQFGE